MNKFVSSLAFLFFFFTNTSDLFAQVSESESYRNQGEDPSSVARVDMSPPFVQDTTVVNQVTLVAEPPGGIQAFMRWIGENYNYPQKAVDVGVSGTLLIRFIVEVDGSISNITVLRDLGYGTGAEAVRVLKKSRRWKPGIAEGKPVRSRFDLPITLSVIDADNVPYANVKEMLEEI
ncbi:energy transducer TonB [Sphingobacterium corticibacterium]|nr:energy transducer TonB [Sphingobacterium corticibacterium]